MTVAYSGLRKSWLQQKCIFLIRTVHLSALTVFTHRRIMQCMNFWVPPFHPLENNKGPVCEAVLHPCRMYAWKCVWSYEIWIFQCLLLFWKVGFLMLLSLQCWYSWTRVATSANRRVPYLDTPLLNWSVTLWISKSDCWLPVWKALSVLLGYACYFQLTHIMELSG